MRVGVIGAGSFGTSIASLLAGKGYDVRLWAREPELVRAINETRENATYLPGFKLPPTLTATHILGEAADGRDMVVMATPSHAAREVAGKLVSALPKSVPIVTVSKGIENETLLTMTEVLEEVLPVDHHPYLAVLSGPSFAKEIAAKLPTAVTVASVWPRVAAEVQKAFSCEYFRAYSSTDVIGVQFGGALKNVVAIAAGCADGLGFGHNTRAALITRGLAEISRAAVRRGANPMPLSGLAGMGDLVLTCTGELSRNRQVGLALGKGSKLEAILKDMKMVAEGVKTAKSAFELSNRLQIDLPISREIYSVIYEDKPARRAVIDLMSRDLKAEI